MKKQGPEYDRGDLIREVATRTATSEDFSGENVGATLNAISDALAEFNRVELHQFGTFCLKWRKDRTVTLNGVDYLVPGHWRVTFKAAPALAQIISDKTGEPAK